MLKNAATDLCHRVPLLFRERLLAACLLGALMPAEHLCWKALIDSDVGGLLEVSKLQPGRRVKLRQNARTLLMALSSCFSLFIFRLHMFHIVLHCCGCSMAHSDNSCKSFRTLALMLIFIKETNVVRRP